VDYQQAAVPAPGTDVCQPQLARLRTVAVGVLSSHLNDHGRCAVCGAEWPRDRAVLAEHNLAICGGTGAPKPSEPVSWGQRCRSRTHARNGRVSRQPAFWPATQPRQASQRTLGGDMTMQWLLRNSLQLGALPTAAPCARLHAKHLLWEWGLQEIADTAELLVSELITNGVKAAQAMKQKPPVWLRLSANDMQLLIEVWDGNTLPPEPRELKDGIPALEDEGGRGLFLVASLSDRWNWHLTQEPEGKVVWCELGMRRPDSSEDRESASRTSLPRRVTHAQHVPPAKAMNNPFTLRRVRDGLRELDHAVQIIAAHTGGMP
jgi:anti-sigma regulatory factor (Ser/Thr protein kinase)